MFCERIPEPNHRDSVWKPLRGLVPYSCSTKTHWMGTMAAICSIRQKAELFALTTWDSTNITSSRTASSLTKV